MADNWIFDGYILTNGTTQIALVNNLTVSRGYNRGSVKINVAHGNENYTEVFVMDNDTLIGGVAPTDLTNAVELFNRLISDGVTALRDSPFTHIILGESNSPNGLNGTNFDTFEAVTLAKTTGNLVFPFDVKLKAFGAYHHNALPTYPTGGWGWSIGFEDRGTSTVTHLKDDTGNYTVVGDTDNQYSEFLIGADLNDLIIPANNHIFVELIAFSAINEGDVTIEGGFLELEKLV